MAHLRCDSSVADAYLQYDFPSAQSNVYVTLDVQFDAAALALFGTGGGYSGIFAEFDYSSGLAAFIDIEDHSGTVWFGGATTNFESGTPAPAADTWQTVELHFQQGTIIQAWVDGTSIGTETPGGFISDAANIRVGQISANIDPDAIVLVDNVKVGTSRGGSDLLFDNFESGTFNAWTSTSGDVTIAGEVSGGLATPGSRDWRWDLCDRYGALITTLDPYVGERQLDFNLNRPCSASGRIPSELSAVSAVHGDGFPRLDAGRRTLKCWRYENDSWVLRFAGIIWQVRDEADENNAYTSFTAFDPFQFLFKRMIRRNDGNLKKTVTLANNAAAAVRRHIEKTIQYAGECYIDVANGYFEPGLVYVTLKYEQEYLARAFMELFDTGVVDLIVNPVDQTDGILCTFSAVERRGSDISDLVRFEYDIGDFQAQNWGRELDMETAANTLTNFSGDKKRISFFEDSTSQADFGVMEDCRVLVDIQHQNILDALTGQELAERKDPRENVGVLPMPATSAVPFEDYDLGDEVGVQCSNAAREAINGQQRIFGFTLQPDSEGVERVTELRVIPAT